MVINSRMAVTLAALLAASGAGGAEVERATQQEPDVQYALSTGVLYTDNVERTASDGETATVATAGIELHARRASERLSYRADSDVTFLDYLDTHLPNQEIGTFDGAVSYAFVPERLRWVAEDDFGQTRVDNLSPAAPDNRQNVNWMSTGPEASLRLTQNVFAQLSARYGRETYETTPYDNDRVSGQLRLVRQSSAEARFGVGVSSQHVDYENESQTGGNYDLTEAVGLYRASSERTEARVELGYAKLDLEHGSKDDPVVRVEASRQVSSFSTVRASVVQEYSTSALQSLGETELTPIISGDYVLGQSSPYRLRVARVGWTSQWARTRLELSAQTGKEDDAGGTNPRSSLSGFSASVTRRLTPNTDFRVFGGLASNYVEGATYGGGDDSLLGASIQWKLGRTLAASLQVAHVNEADYDENGVWLRLIYAPAGTVQRALEELAPL
jgi:hypothetical protein